MTHRPLLAAAALLLLCAPLVAGEAPDKAPDEGADELRAAEIAFAASVADRDAERFASFIDEDAIFLGATALRGREAIVQGWAVFFAEDGPELTWRPEIVELRPDGLGLTRGPYTLTATAPDGTESASSGVFTSIWRRAAEGGWQVIFDAGCPPCAAAKGPEE